MKPKQPDVVKTTIRFPRQLLARAKQQATMENASVQDLVLRVLEHYLKQKGGHS